MSISRHPFPAALVTLALAAVGASCAGTPSTPQMRQAYVTELVHAYERGELSPSPDHFERVAAAA